MIREVTSFLAAHLAAGGLFVTAVLTLSNRMPESFLRFCTASACGLSLIAFLLGSGHERAIFLGLALVALVWYGTIRTGSGAAAFGAWLGGLGALVGAIAFATSMRHEAHYAAIASSLSSSLLLGSVTVTMVLGHWYLVDTTLSIAPLRKGALWVWIAMLARLSAVLWVLFLGGWEILRVSRLADFVFSTNGLFFLFRSVMGLFAPLLLTVLIWQTVKIRSTQSATGLLYVALMLVLFGELVSQFLRVRTGYPL